MKNIKKKKKGFTLIELVIVIAIIAILAAIAVPKFSDVRKDAREQADIANAKTIANAAIILMADGELTADATGATGTKVEKKAATATTTTNGNKVAKSLQSIPNSKSVTGGFYISVSDDGDVEVRVGTATGEVFFPRD